MAWTGQTFSVGQILTAAQMNNLQADITAHANGDTGAPQQQTAGIADLAVTQAKIATAAVGQGQLKTTTASGSVYIAANTSGTYSLAGGTYSMWTIGSGTSASNPTVGYFGGGDTAAGVIGVYSDLSSTYFFFNERYIQASPPYDLGDGEIARFIFLLLNSNGELHGHQEAAEAPWHYHGPTNIKAVFYRNGKGYRLRRDMSKIPFTLEEAKADPVKLAEYMAAFNSAPIVEEEITQAIKNADMPLIPHPFMGNDLTGKTVVLLDPVSDLTWKLAEMCECHDQFNLNELLHAGRFIIDNTPLPRKGPPGVPVVGYRWKNTP